VPEPPEELLPVGEAVDPPPPVPEPVAPAIAPPLDPVVTVAVDTEPEPPALAEDPPEALDAPDPLADEIELARELICEARLLAALLAELATLADAMELLYALSPVMMNSPLDVKSVGIAPDFPPAMARVYRPAVKFLEMIQMCEPEFGMRSARVETGLDPLTKAIETTSSAVSGVH
jgi:hypothetical protein